MKRGRHLQRTGCPAVLGPVAGRSQEQGLCSTRGDWGRRSPGLLPPNCGWCPRVCECPVPYGARVSPCVASVCSAASPPPSKTSELVSTMSMGSCQSSCGFPKRICHNKPPRQRCGCVGTWEVRMVTECWLSSVWLSRWGPWAHRPVSRAPSRAVQTRTARPRDPRG